jgi:hypothetical protein
MDVKKKELLAKLYHDPSSPAGFSGITNLYKEARKHDNKICKNDVIYFLEGERTYTLHRPRRIRFPRSKTVPAGYFTDIQMDLAQMDKFASKNKGYKYFLVAIDVLSKSIFAEPLKSKKYEDVVKVMDLVINKMPMIPQRIFTDNGKEFFLNKKYKVNGQFKSENYFKNKGIEKHWSSTKTVKAALAERSIRTIKSRIYRYFSEKRTLNWIDVLPQIIKAINNTPSRITGMKPLDVNFDNAQELWDKLYHGVYDKTKRETKFKKGDTVRMANYAEPFDRGYLPNWSDEVLNIDSVKKNNPETYKVKDDDGEFFKGNYYKYDLGSFRKDEDSSYRIEKIYSKRTKDGVKEIRVKFFGYPRLYWIKEGDIVN